MTKNSYLDDMIEHMLADPKMRQIFNMAYPRRIVPPHGYMNPRYYAPTTASSVFMTMTHPDMADFVKSCIFFITRKLTMLHVPTFFVGQEFAEAIWETDIESDMRSDEIVWPDEAMLFVLPEKFVMEHLGYNIPFLAMANYTKEEIRGMKNIHVTKADGTPAAEGAINNMDGQVFMNFQWHPKTDEPGIDYISSWPVSATLARVAEELRKGPLAVMTEEKEAMAAGVLDKVGMADEDIERDLLCKMRDFSAKLLMAMTDEPHFIQRGLITRKAKVKHNKVIEELWSPNTLGATYRHPYADGAGTHASPRLHRRRGYRRDQHYGPGNSLTKKVRIWPCWVNAKPKNEN